MITRNDHGSCYEHLEDYYRTPKKVFEGCFIAFFESKSIESKRGRREEKRRKTHFVTWKSLFLFLLFYNYSIAFAVQRQIEELKLALP
jgi:hypothetical protein